MTTARREEILAAALEVFAERGYRGASFDAVAERAGLTRQGVLHYFPSKTRLLMAVLEFRARLNREHLAEHPGGDLPSRLAEVVAFDHEIPALAQIYSVLLAETVVADDPALEAFHEHYRSIYEYAIKHLTDLYGERLPSGLTPRAAATAMLVMVDGLQQQWLLNRDQGDYPEIMRDVLSVLLGSTPV
jgi:AcrR family transcriptional regulator